MKKNTKNTLTLHLVSDSTGETLKAVSSAAAAQFSELEYQQKTYPMVRTVTQLERVFKNIKDEKGVVFCTLVEEIAKTSSTKFLVITHHRMTMARVNRLFGVTMPEQGVSQLVSVDLEKAIEIRKQNDE